MKYTEPAMAFIRESIRTRGYPPSRRELGGHLGIKSTSQTQDVIADLVREGLIEVDPKITRGIRVKGSVMKARTEEM